MDYDLPSASVPRPMGAVKSRGSENLCVSDWTIPASHREYKKNKNKKKKKTRSDPATPQITCLGLVSLI